MIACVVVVGLSTSSGSAFAVGSPRASTVSPTFCQSASDAFTSTANVLPATVVSSSISAQYVILLDNAVGAYTRLVAQTPSSGPKSAYQRAVTSFKRALGDERSAHSTSSPSAQRAAADQYRAGLAALVGASSLPYRSCVGLKIVIGETIASSLSWDAIKAAAASHRVVTTSDLRHSAAAVDGVRVVTGVTGTSRVAKFHVTLASATSGDYCVLEPTSVRGAQGNATPC